MLFIVCLIFLVSQASLIQAYEDVQRGSTGEKVELPCRKCSVETAPVQRSGDRNSGDSKSQNEKLTQYLSQFRQDGGKLSRDGTNRRAQQTRTSNRNPFFNNAIIVPENDERLIALNMKVCGNAPLTDRIINGKEAAQGQHCYIAQLYYKPVSSPYHYYYYNSEPPLASLCAGSLIQSQWVLTAAHCIAGTLGERLKLVHLGEHNSGTDPDCHKQSDGTSVCSPPVQKCDVVKKIPHPQYNSKALINDIALLQLNESAKVNQETICLVCLPVGGNQFFIGEKSKLTVAGWGTTESSHSSKVLLTVDVPYVDLDTCWRSRSLVTKDNCLICAGGGDKDSCTGDSGSCLTTWLAYNETDDEGKPYPVYRATQLGVVSYGPTPCAKEGKMGVYTSVSCHNEFIFSTMMQNQNVTRTRQRNYNVHGRG